MLSKKDKRTKYNKNKKKRNNIKTKTKIKNRKYTKLRGGSRPKLSTIPEEVNGDLNKGYTYIATLGTGEAGNNNNQFNTPSDVAISFNGKFIYIADTMNGRVQVFVYDGSKYEYDHMIGNGKYNQPRGVAVPSVSEDNFVYVADTNNNVIEIYKDEHDIKPKIPNTIEIPKKNKKNKKTNNTNKLINIHIDTIGPQVNLYAPLGVAVSSDNNRIYVVSRNNCVQIFDGDDYKYMSTLGENYFIKDKDKKNVLKGLVFENYQRGDYAFICPAKVAISTYDNRIYVADTYNHRVQIFDAKLGNYTFKGTLGTTSKIGYDNTHFNHPCGVAISPVDNRIYVADTNNHRIQIFNGKTLEYISTLGQSTVSFSDNTHFNCPYSVAVSPTDNRIYVADTNNHRIQIFESQTKDTLLQ